MAGVALATLSSVSAQAAVVLQTGTEGGGNVLVDAGTGPTVTGHFSSSPAIVTFSSLIDTSLVGQPSGQARVEAADGVLNAIAFELDAAHGFTEARFNLNPLGPALSSFRATGATASFYGIGGGLLGSASIGLNPTGNNHLTAFGNAGEVFTKIAISFSGPTNAGIADIRQVRMDVVNVTTGVPEPATWGMMILGFGVVGGAMRRRKAAVRVTYA